ncbi:hypothetical protein PAXRUDRAFT_17998 [Paxillus rubicundulus Ve08.2h10]|uniref:Uncharacterized protein n=1 Tax=Paxillus rubicundulus Ve08.2h10 TaxID=930991 RepID=A0A0D0C080_9AGAM|nr:hypothetical protein PAXRUDRAFT_17998 [Paxillus rubicundulus Ve08.2h10]
MTNPHEEECPDHMLLEFKEAHLLFTVEGKTDEEAAALLSNLWDFNNNKEKLVWDRERAVEIEAQQEEHKCEYVPLYFFTNKSIQEAEDDSSRDEDLLTLSQTNKGPTFQTAASVKAKKHKVRDEQLSWEEFSQANYCMITVMKQQEWLDK